MKIVNEVNLVKGIIETKPFELNEEEKSWCSENCPLMRMINCK